MKTPKPRKLKSGNWFVQLRLNGESIPITAETETECRHLAELIKAEHNTGKRVVKKTPKGTTLKEAMEKFIAENKATLSPSTVRSYTFYVKSRFPDYINKPINKINWQEMIDKELEIVSGKTVKNAWALVTPSLKNIGYPVPTVRLAKVPVKEIPVLQPEEIVPFCEAVKGKPYEIAALLELHGLRLSEVRGLKWENIDLKNNVINVSGAKVTGIDGDIYKQTNKNQTSTRPVPIMIPQLKEALNAVQDKTGFVVSQTSRNLLKDINRACIKAGVTVCSNHSLRHSFASLCFFLGIPMKQIEEWGGWGNSTVLNRIYIRLSASAKTDNQKAFEKFFKNQNANKMLTDSEKCL